MSISEKITEIKKIIEMICELLPSLVNLVREVIALLHEVKTV